MWVREEQRSTGTRGVREEHEYERSTRACKERGVRRVRARDEHKRSTGEARGECERITNTR